MHIAFTESGQPIHLAYSSLGDAAQTQSIANMAAAGATTTTSILATLGTFGAMGGPITAAVAGIAAIGVALVKLFSGCGQTCIQATAIANQAEPLLLQNLNHYLNSPIRYKSMQLAALNNFDTIWAALYKACSNQALQQAGVNCIQDRQQGACHYQASPGGWAKDASGVWSYTGYGANGSGTACWNWFVGYRDPIANDPDVQPDPPNATYSTDPVTGQIVVTPNQTAAAVGSFMGSNPALVIGGAALLMMFAMGDR